MWQQVQIDTLLAIAYLLCWVTTFVVYHYKHWYMDSGSLIIFLYVVYGAVSVYSVSDDLIAGTMYAYDPLTPLPYLYLFVLMVVALLPLFYVHRQRPSAIAPASTRVLTIVAIIVVVSCLLYVPSLVSSARTGLLDLVADPTAGKEAYEETIAGASDSGKTISNIPAIIFNATSEVGIFLFFYFLTLRHKCRLLIIGLFAAMVVGMAAPLLSGLRGGVIISLETALMAYFLFRQYLSQTINRAATGVGLTVIVLLMIPIMAITFSRAGNRGITSFASWYIGQGSLYFNNYALDAGGTRHGDRTFYLVKRLIDPDTPTNYFERRSKYRKLNVDDDIFTTFVGDFVIDFGPYVAAIIFIVFFLWARHALHIRGDTIELSQLLLLYIVACISIQGGMSLYNFADMSGLKLVVLFALYAYLVYHKHLLEKFPLDTTTS